MLRKRIATIAAITLLSGCSMYSSLDYEVRPSKQGSGVTLVCKDSSSGICEFLTEPADGPMARIDVHSGEQKDIQAAHPGMKVCAVVRRGAVCTPREVAVSR
jgi:hypothetical protein